MARRTGAKTDPALQRQLDAAKGTDRPVEAVLSLRPEMSTKSRASKSSSSTTASGSAPSGARSRADSAIERVQKEVGSKPAAVNVLENLDIVVIAAQEPFMRKLLEQPEFESAVANESDETS
jgi:hypothetical protein